MDSPGLLQAPIRGAFVALSGLGEDRTGAPRSPKRTWAENELFSIAFPTLAANLVRAVRAMVGLPPDFLLSLVALAKFMRLSS
jgi:hypothetical protein